ncbi:MAG TPA: DUF3313 domain-containing protein [Candidatus Binataceae bacterium]|nr:DUF3313 domain-containing protein [Candidatus Binataceae bacterium]
MANEPAKLLTGLLSATLAGWLLMGCSQTTAPAPNIVQRVEGETPAPPPPSGFLGSDYALLKPPAEGSDQKAMLVYTDASASFASYSKIMIAPVTFWGDEHSNLSAADQQTLCDYFYNVLKEELGKNFTLVNEPGPGVAKLTVALTDASSAIPVLRTIAVVVPQARVLSMIKQGLTGTYSFVGSATGEAKLTDSVSGQLLAAWSDKRFGSGALKNVTVWQWGDADNAMNYWADGLDQRLATLGIQHTATPAATK